MLTVDSPPPLPADSDSEGFKLAGRSARTRPSEPQPTQRPGGPDDPRREAAGPQRGPTVTDGSIPGRGRTFKFRGLPCQWLRRRARVDSESEPT